MHNNNNDRVKIIVYEYLFSELQRAENAVINSQNFVKMYKPDEIDLLEYILAVNRYDNTSKILKELIELIKHCS